MHSTRSFPSLGRTTTLSVLRPKELEHANERSPLIQLPGALYVLNFGLDMNPSIASVRSSYAANECRARRAPPESPRTTQVATWAGDNLNESTPMIASENKNAPAETENPPRTRTILARKIRTRWVGWGGGGRRPRFFPPGRSLPRAGKMRAGVSPIQTRPTIVPIRGDGRGGRSMPRSPRGPSSSSRPRRPRPRRAPWLSCRRSSICRGGSAGTRRADDSRR